MDRRTAIIAHRGASSYVLENTLEAFLLAEKQKAIIEMDVRKTLDDVFVISHDRGIKKGRKVYWIDKHSYDELRKNSSRTLLRLNDVFQKLSNKTVIDLDVKQKGVEEELASFLINNHRDSRVIVDSYYPGSIIRFGQLLPKAKIGMSLALEDRRDFGKRRSVRLVLSISPYLLRRILSPIITKVARRCHCDIVNMQVRFASKKNIDLVHAIGVKVYVWRVDKEKQMKKMIALGVDGIKTGKPDLLRRVINEYYR